MFLVDQLIFLGALLLLAGILALRFGARLGVPFLVLFIFIGMLAGEEGIGGIIFENYELAHALGTFALALILFDGGLRTPLKMLRIAWRPALTLATLGVLITAGLTGTFAAWVLGLSLLQGLLLGGIVGSTDAAAVFSVLRSSGLGLRERLEATLEIESGSNDPMAIFLTIGLIEVLLGGRSLGAGLATLFLLQIGVGLVAGYVLGKASAYIINKINLDAPGLYPVLVVTLGLASYGTAALLGGSGFLAVYVTGVVVGNSRLVFQRGTLLFHDGIAWVAQIGMFVLLGLLSFPSELAGVAIEGLAVAGMLMFIARPAAVFASLLPFGFSWREVLLLSWGGLKGAVPIILATFPLLFGMPGGFLYFNVVFFVVLVSALLQGTTLPHVAKRLGLKEEGGTPPPPITLDISSVRDINADIVSYLVTENCGAAHLRISELSLPEEAVVAMVSRGDEIIPPRGATVLLPGDHAFMILRQEVRPQVDRVFAEHVPTPPIPLRAGLYVPPEITIGHFEELYGVSLDKNKGRTLIDYMRERHAAPLAEGSFVEAHGLRLFAARLEDGAITRIGVEWLHAE